MTLRAILWALDQDVDCASKLILVKLGDNADEITGLTWPGVDSIAKVCRCSRRTVQRRLRLLEDANLITTVRAGGQNGGNSDPTKYRINGDWDGFKGCQIDTPPSQKSDDQQGCQNDTGKKSKGRQIDTGGASHSHEGASACHERGVTQTPEPVIEPVINQKEKETREEPVDNSAGGFEFSDLKSWGYFAGKDPTDEESHTGLRWVENGYSREEVKAAMEIAVGNLGKPNPPLTYIDGIIRNRQVAAMKTSKPKTNGPQQTESTDPLGENTADYEAAAARKLERQVAEQKAKAAQSTEPDLGVPVPEKRADRLGTATGVDPGKVASVQAWFVEQGYPSEAVMGDEQRVRIEAWVELNVTPKLLREFLQRAVNQRKAKPLDPVRVINGPLVGELTARRNSQGSQSNQNTTEPMRAEA